LDINMEENTFLNADNIYEEVEGEDGKTLQLEEDQSRNLVGIVRSRFADAERARQGDEERWLQSYQNFRGLYGKRVRFRESEKSRVFIKVTKTKTVAAYGQLIDVLFGTGQFPISVKETRLPEGIAKEAHINLNQAPVNIEGPYIESGIDVSQVQLDENPFNVGFEGDGKVLKAGATLVSGEDFLSSLEDNYVGTDGEIVLTEGSSAIPAPTINPAQIAARNMEKLIHDQLEESNGISELRNSLFEAAMLGTGILKGPFSFNKTLHRWTQGEEGRNYTPTHVRVPRVEFVSCWDFYPDPNATTMEECDYIVHRHKFNRSQVRNLRNMPYFDKDAIRNVLQMGPNYEARDFEDQITADEDRSETDYSDRYEILEYWGIMDADYAREVGIDLPDTVDDLDEVQINAWTCGAVLLRAVVNPFTPPTLPYHAFPYEKNPYSFFGIGVPENMLDSQQIMNGHARMAIDNLALSGSLVFDVDESALVGGQSMDIYPGKIFRRQAGMPGQSIHGIKFPNTATENMMMFDKFRQLADEQTGIPSYSHGQTGVQSMTRTASGMSMLLGASSLNIKTVIKNIDDFLLKPLGEAFFHWNMQFIEEDLDIIGDLEIEAMGTASLMQKEVRSQRLTMFLQTAQNPAIAPFVKMSKLISELAFSLDLDPEEILNSPEEAAIAAQIIGMQNAQQTTGEETAPTGQPPTGMGSPTGAPQPPEELDRTGSGGGNIGTGIVPQPGEVGFSGNIE
tara:strand:- start:1233 stop:3440 length:2208 start_codon:yes stop_codon:yes gene_type:complete